MIEIYALTNYGRGLSKSIDAPWGILGWRIIDILSFNHRATFEELKAQLGDTTALHNALYRLQRHKPPVVIKEGAELV